MGYMRAFLKIGWLMLVEIIWTSFLGLVFLVRNISGNGGIILILCMGSF